MSFRSLSVPANLLLSGEYFVLLEGGLGFTAAPELRATAEVIERPGGTLTVLGRFGGQTLEWEEHGEADDSFMGRLTRAVAAELEPEKPPALEIRIDTSAFYDFRGVKRGFGSSAAAAVLVTAALLSSASGRRLSAAELLSPCVAAHRAAQGGRGSGYDVAASLFGGTGLFTGGALPSWRPLPADAGLAALEIRGGEAPVSSSDAIDRFEACRQREPGLIAGLLNRNNALHARLPASRSFDDTLRLLVLARELGIELGGLIGVPAAPAGAESATGSKGFWKAAGAGNETLFRPHARPSSGALPLSREGLCYE